MAASVSVEETTLGVHGLSQLAKTLKMRVECGEGEVGEWMHLGPVWTTSKRCHDGFVFMPVREWRQIVLTVRTKKHSATRNGSRTDIV